MPWTVADVEHKKRGLSKDQKRKWVRIANAVLEQTGNDAVAISVANKQVGRPPKKGA